MGESDTHKRLVKALTQVASGDHDALRIVYDLTSSALLGVIVRIVRSRELAEDVLQEVYVKVWSRASRFQADRASPITWLAAIARNSAIDAVRKRGRRPSGNDDDLHGIAAENIAADELLCIQEDHDAVRRCMDELSADHRRSIQLAFYEGLTHSELAERLDVPLGTMKSWIRRGLSGLKGCLGHGR